MTDSSRSNRQLTLTVQAVGLAVFVLICLAAAALGGITTGPAIDGWYRTLEKPPWQPPNWVFGPVWSVLYLLMAVAAWLVWMRAGFRAAVIPLGLFAVQLVLNVAWSWTFFAFTCSAGLCWN